MRYGRLFITLIVISAALSACDLMNGADSGSLVEENTLATPIPATSIKSATETPQPSPTCTLSPTFTATSTPVVVLPPEPVEVQFEAADGQLLTGRYYPADVNPAPVIVLMPWSRGNQSDWEEVAYWLQGRGLLERDPDYNHTWRSAVWFPERTLEMPLGVFTFDFRSCQGSDGCQAYLPAEWLLDARAALETASELEGASREGVLAVGASIGADGAMGSCVWMNANEKGSCLGVFALSPASLLTEDFRGLAASLLSQDVPAPVYCLYGLRDDASVETCGEFQEIKAIDYGYVEYHGMEILQPDRKPDPLLLLQEFILEALGGTQ